MSNPSLLFGIISGIATVLYTLIFYFIDKKMMLGASVYWSSLFIFVIFMFWCLYRIRRSQNGSLSFSEGVRGAFQVFVIADLIFYAFYWLLFTVDPGLEDVAREIALEAFEYAKQHQSDRLQGQSIEEYARSLKEEDFGVGFSMLLSKFSYGVIGGFLLSLVIAGIVQRKK